ncbi:CrcB family protein [Kytococcus sedentarius]|uniref:CrcB family protein n=1 Tax=Kytococcus sedentarius TaxID=1276 RepID=UPI0006612AC6|nr:CrcB family protein [Kytococcus sedentarius]
MMRTRIPDSVVVGAGGVAGSAARAALDQVAAMYPARGLFLPWSTLAVNALGAFGLGLLGAWVAGRIASGAGNPSSLRRLRLLAGTGFAGAFTTYGTYIIASVGYASLNGVAEAVAQSLGLLALGGACAWAGTEAGQRLGNTGRAAAAQRAGGDQA